MATVTKKRLEENRRRNEAAIKAADRRSAALQAALERSRAMTKAALDVLKRAGYVK